MHLSSFVTLVSAPQPLQWLVPKTKHVHRMGIQYAQAHVSPHFSRLHNWIGLIGLDCIGLDLDWVGWGWIRLGWMGLLFD